MVPMETAEKTTGKFERLPVLAKPTNYNLKLKPDMKNFTFEGEETIQLDIIKTTNFLKFHCSDIKIKNIQLNAKEGERWETVQVDLPIEIASQSGVSMTIEFDGKLNDKMKGFYRSQYKTKSGEVEYLASTQFESTSARKAFPCWDEPIYKATYDITLVVPKDKMALSNMPEIRTVNRPDGLKAVTFATSPIMSSYLVAFVVGNFDFIESTDTNGVRVRVYTLPGRKEQGQFALDVATKSLAFYGEFFNVRYSLPKCDLIAIPDFHSGAMENWGLVTYRETALLIDPNFSSTRARDSVALTVAHELAHMWFGNLVTMEWWTDLWLKEGYAVWMQYYCVDWLFPDFDIWKRLVHMMQPTITVDALKNSHPIEIPINDPEEVEGIYDLISYVKSASVIRMLHDFLGDDAFRNGLRSYLAKFSYRNAVTQDLWDSLSESSGRNVTQIMSNWTQKMGFPMVKISSRQEGNKRILNLQQRRFIADSSGDEEHTIWRIPISLTTSSNPDKAAFKILLTEKEQDVVLNDVQVDEWVLLNSGSIGYYRVQYSDEMLKPLLAAIKENQIKVADRLIISGDIFALARAGLFSTASFLDLLENYENETDYIVWSNIDKSMATLANCLERTDYVSTYHAFCRKFYSKIVEKLGWDQKPGESHADTLLRPLVLGRLGRSGDGNVLNKARTCFYEYVDGKCEMIPDLRPVIFEMIGRYDGVAGYDALQKVFEKSDFSEVKLDALYSMSRTTLPDLQKRILDYGLTDKVRLQDYVGIYAGLCTSMVGQGTAWNYVKTNLKMLMEKYGNTSNMLLIHTLKLASESHCSEEKAKEIEEFFHEHDYSAAWHRPIKESLEMVRLNAGLLKRDSENIKTWLTMKGF